MTTPQTNKKAQIKTVNLNILKPKKHRIKPKETTKMQSQFLLSDKNCHIAESSKTGQPYKNNYLKK